MLSIISVKSEQNPLEVYAQLNGFNSILNWTLSKMQTNVLLIARNSWVMRTGDSTQERVCASEWVLSCLM